MAKQEFNSETHIKGDDGQIYERKIVAATGIAVRGGPKTALATAMREAVEKAHAEGETDPNRLRTLIHEAHDRHMNQSNEDTA